MYTREQIESVIASCGCQRENIFLVISESDPQCRLPVLWYPEIGIRLWGIEKDELFEAVTAYLFDHGFRRFASTHDIWCTIESEKWPGWDTCEDVMRANPPTPDAPPESN